jgi:integrase
MQTQGTRRFYGTGSIHEHRGAWYGKWRVHGRQVKRKLGPIRKPGSRDGLTRKQAEARLRKLMGEAAPPPVAEAVTVREAGQRLIFHLEGRGRKLSTIANYKSYLAVHIAPEFGEQHPDKITVRDVEQFIAKKRQAATAKRKPKPGEPTRSRQSVKSIHNYLGFLHSIFEFAIAEGWATQNPVKHARKPERGDEDADVRFLNQDELDALLRAAPTRVTAESVALWLVDRVMYLTAAMTGLRQGELLALRWIDIDWTAKRVRVRRNFVRGEYGTPKSKRSTRSVPLADRVAGELHRLYVATAYQADDDLVFAHSQTGKPMERSNLLKRYKRALKRAKVRPVRFHDLRHTFGTRMAAAGVPMRTLQEWMGHRDFKTTLIYADYAPSAGEADLVEAAFGVRADPLAEATVSRS